MQFVQYISQISFWQSSNELIERISDGIVVVGEAGVEDAAGAIEGD
jgi:hypothetical protein